jgi:predicted metal-binding protein
MDYITRPSLCESIVSSIRKLGATYCQFIPSYLLVPEERIRTYCYQNICGSYNVHLTCPPHTGTIGEIKQKLKKFKTGILIQYSENINVQEDHDGLRRTKLKFHHIVLEIEKYLKRKMNLENIWGMIGGNCALCDECAGYRGKPCMYPDKARISMEALAIDVIGLLTRLQLDATFYQDKITWTGIVLIDKKCDVKLT